MLYAGLVCNLVHSNIKGNWNCSSVFHLLAIDCPVHIKDWLLLLIRKLDCSSHNLQTQFHIYSVSYITMNCCARPPYCNYEHLGFVAWEPIFLFLHIKVFPLGASSLSSFLASSWLFRCFSVLYFPFNYEVKQPI